MTLAPGSTIGILGGGQLARMLALAGARLGLKVLIYDPAPDSPASQISPQITGAWDDQAALTRFGEATDVITYEFENIPTAALDLLEAHAPIHPGRNALATSQDRLTEKSFLRDLGIPVAPFAPVQTMDKLSDALDEIGAPAILKTRTLGYDGKGQARIKTVDDAVAALDAMAGAPAILEGFVDFSCEISVIIARGPDGATAAFDPGENLHEDGILRRTTVPASVDAQTQTDAKAMAGRIAEALGYVGVLGVEFFVTPTGLAVNEIAPRVHNSGHWTQAACVTCQFEQHMRAVAGWPLGNGARHGDAIMENLIGSEVDTWPELATQNVSLHLYGKAEARPGRKMGHWIKLG